MLKATTRTEIRDPVEATSRERQDLAYRQLRDLIVTGQLAPGAPIIEARVAERLNLTRTPVRAALLRLEQEGYVVSAVMEKYSRTLVAPMTAEAAKELFSIQAALEGIAVRIAAGFEPATREQIAAEMEDLNRALFEASTGKPSDVVRAQDLHVRFHRVVVDAAAGPRLYAQIEAVQPQVERYERLYTHVLISGIENSVREHTAVIAAIRAGDAAGAQRSVEANWRNGADRYESILALNARGTW